jgi:Zn-dependent protease
MIFVSVNDVVMRPSFGPGTANGIPPPPPRCGSAGERVPSVAAVSTGQPIRGVPVSHGMPVQGVPVLPPPARVIDQTHGNPFGAAQIVSQDMPMTVSCGTLKLPARWGGHRVPIRLHAMIGVVPLVSAFTVLARGGGGLGFLLVLLSTGPLLVVMTLVHELGHISEAARHGCTPSHILLWPLGGLAVISTAEQSHWQHAQIAAAGPATHVPMIAVWLLLLALTGHMTLSMAQLTLATADGWFAILFAQQVINNLVVFGFNLLLPCFPLDCSQIVVSVLLMRGWPLLRVAHAILVSSAVALVAVVGHAIAGIAAGWPSASLGLVVAVFLGVQISQLHAAYQVGPDALEMYPLFRGRTGGTDGTHRPVGEMPMAARPLAGGVLAALVAVASVPLS